MKQNISCIVLAFIFVSCAASLPYTTDYPLTQEIFHSRDGTLLGKIPQGWFSSTEDTLAPALLVWLIKEDFSATLAVKELKLDRLSAKRVEKDGLALLAHINLGWQTVNSSNEIKMQEFKMNGKKFCSYEISDGLYKKRSVVFSARGQYYECEARIVKGDWHAEAIKRLFTVQQSVLSSLEF